MNEHLGDLLSAYLDGSLHADELARIADHLDGCGDCIAEFRAVQQGRSAVRMLPWLEMPEGLEPHAGDLLSAYLDGELVETEGGLVERHLAACAGCRDELYELDAARSAVRSLPTLEFLPSRQPLLPPAARHRAVALAGWAAGIAAAAAISLGVLTADRTSEPVDLDSIASRHSARVSVETGLPVVPVMFPAGAGP
jgi:predicted anti-sigma-YlaC factor YlaD